MNSAVRPVPRDSRCHTYRRGGWFIWPWVALSGFLGVGWLALLPAVQGAGAQAFLIACSALMLVLAVALARWNRQRGVKTDALGIRNVGIGRQTVTPWSQISAFAIGSYGPGLVAVFMERKDGSREALQHMINWPFRKDLTEQFLKSLDDELAAARGEAQDSSVSAAGA